MGQKSNTKEASLNQLLRKSFPVIDPSKTTGHTDDSIGAAVSIIFFKTNQILFPSSNSKNESYHTLLQMRPPQGSHASQISFPGGRKEPSDRNLFQTAKRELEEETGLIAKSKHFFFMPAYFVGGSNTKVQPYVWIQEGPISIFPNKIETMYFYLPKLSSLLDHEQQFSFSFLSKKVRILGSNTNENSQELNKKKEIERAQGAFVFDSPGIYLGNDVLWGASFGMIKLLFKSLGLSQEGIDSL
jgi:8-oxo-dGTP pyrophosphatase MutT (NUDIX family)